MAYNYRKPPAVAPPWWLEWGVPYLVLALVLGLLIKGCSAGWDAYRQHQREVRAAAVLEPLNAWRRQVGLAPVTAALPLRSFEGDSLVHLSSSRHADKQRYTPYLGMKHLRYAGKRQQVLWEVDVWHLCSAGCKTPAQSAWRLERTYTSNNKSKLSFRLLDGGSRSLTRTEADSVLTTWRKQGRYDSLAATGR